MERMPTQKATPKGSLGIRADLVEGAALVKPGPKAAAVTDVAGWGDVVA
jgi:hypothetical protein